MGHDQTLCLVKSWIPKFPVDLIGIPKIELHHLPQVRKAFLVHRDKTDSRFLFPDPQYLRINRNWEILIQSNDSLSGVILSKVGIRGTENPGKADIESLKLYHFPFE